MPAGQGGTEQGWTGSAIQQPEGSLPAEVLGSSRQLGSRGQMGSSRQVGSGILTRKEQTDLQVSAQEMPHPPRGLNRTPDPGRLEKYSGGP